MHVFRWGLRELQVQERSTWLANTTSDSPKTERYRLKPRAGTAGRLDVRELGGTRGLLREVFIGPDGAPLSQTAQ